MGGGERCSALAVLDAMLANAGPSSSVASGERLGNANDGTGPNGTCQVSAMATLSTNVRADLGRTDATSCDGSGGHEMSRDSGGRASVHGNRNRNGDTDRANMHGGAGRKMTGIGGMMIGGSWWWVVWRNHGHGHAVDNHLWVGVVKSDHGHGWPADTWQARGWPHGAGDRPLRH